MTTTKSASKSASKSAASKSAAANDAAKKAAAVKAENKNATAKANKANVIDVSAEAESNTNPPSVGVVQQAVVNSIPHSSGSFLVTERDGDNNIKKQYLSTKAKNK